MRRKPLDGRAGRRSTTRDRQWLPLTPEDHDALTQHVERTAALTSYVRRLLRELEAPDVRGGPHR